MSLQIQQQIEECEKSREEICQKKKSGNKKLLPKCFENVGGDETEINTQGNWHESLSVHTYICVYLYICMYIYA